MIEYNKPDTTKLFAALEARKAKELADAGSRATNGAGGSNGTGTTNGTAGLVVNGIDYTDCIPGEEGSQIPAPTAHHEWYNPATGESAQSILENLGILYFYKRWVGKYAEEPGRKTEGIKVSCPNPSHPDNDPSAWANTQKNLINCGGCNMGWDIYKLAADRFGLHQRSDFPKLMEAIGADIGVELKKPHVEVAVPSLTELKQAEIPAAKPQNPAPDDDISPEILAEIDAKIAEDPQKSAQIEQEYQSNPAIKIDWRNIIPPDTFLHDALTQFCEDDFPEEFHFWNLMLATCAGINYQVLIPEDKGDVYCNLFLCLVGSSGSNKSLSMNKTEELMRAKLKFEIEDPRTKGVHFCNANSGQVMVDSCVIHAQDPTKTEEKGGPLIRPNVIFNQSEYARIAALGKQANSILFPVLIDFADAKKVVEAGESRDKGKSVVSKPFAQMWTTTQPDSLSKLFNKTDIASGFMSRNIFARGVNKPKVHIKRRTHDDYTKIYTKFNEILDTAAAIYADGGEMWYTPQGEEMLNNFLVHQVEPYKKNSQFPDLVVRLDLDCKKILIPLAINMKQKEIGTNAVEQMIALFEYFKAMYGATITSLDSEETKLEALITEKLEKNHKKTGEGMSASYLAKFFKRDYDGSFYTRVIGNMEKQDQLYIHGRQIGERGRETKMVELAIWRQQA